MPYAASFASMRLCDQWIKFGDLDAFGTGEFVTQSGTGAKGVVGYTTPTGFTLVYRRSKESFASRDRVADAADVVGERGDFSAPLSSFDATGYRETINGSLKLREAGHNAYVLSDAIVGTGIVF